ncbi:MAG: hypothetical protein C4317_09095 [Acidimicrobiia bacterium]
MTSYASTRCAETVGRPISEARHLRQGSIVAELDSIREDETHTKKDPDSFLSRFHWGLYDQ